VVEAVRGISFAVAPGEVVALVGESGSGKSVSALSALRLNDEPPARYRGQVRWRGEDVLTMGPDRLRRLRGGEIGIVFQEPMTALNPIHRIGRQVGEALELHRSDLDAAGRRSRSLDLLREVGIPEPERRLEQYPHELSGGMRQRICIAMALACEPALLIADEPTTALDVTIQAQILDLLRRLQRSHRMAVLFITHDLGVVADLADRVVLLWQGRKMEEGPVAEVFANPRHPYTKGLLACRPRLDARHGRLPTVADFWNGETPAATPS